MTKHLTKSEFIGKLDYQRILKNPILDIAAQSWENERYEAAKTCYKFMRIVDDLVDDKKSQGGEFNLAEIGNLLDASLQKDIIGVKESFQLPDWLWKSFSESMVYDLQHDGFESFQSFLKYCEGAAVAPASIFLHFCGAVKERGVYLKPKFDVKKVAEPAAIFCYLTHIIRDFQKDQNLGLNYFSDDLLRKNGLTKTDLKEIAAGKEISPEFRNLMRDYYGLAGQYRRKTLQSIEEVKPYLEPQYQLSIELIFNLYSQIYERIDVEKSGFTTAELLPSAEEIIARIDRVLSKAGVV